MSAVHRMRAMLDGWEMLLGGLLIVTFATGAMLFPNFLTPFNLSQLAAGMAEKALLVLPMVLLIIVREIDLSVASMLALCSVAFGVLLQAGFGLPIAIAATIMLGAVLGAANGAMVAFLGLPSLVVTLGTMALFRGLGYIALGTGSVNVFPAAVTDFGIGDIPGTRIPLVIVPFLVLAPLFAIWLQRKPFGQRVYASGGSPAAALYSGINVDSLRFKLFVVSGAVSAIAGMVYTARLANARANNALGMELDVITIVFLGGVSVWGGKGRLTGVFIALALVAVIRNLLAINQIGGDTQSMVIGGLLIGSLLVSNSSTAILSLLRSSAGSRPNG
jgi:rhamnose transport system permease protein